MGLLHAFLCFSIFGGSMYAKHYNREIITTFVQVGMFVCHITYAVEKMKMTEKHKAPILETGTTPHTANHTKEKPE